MKLSAILAPMIAAGVPGEVILATVKAFEDQQNDALEKRRESDRKRQAKHRDNVTSRDVTVTVPSREGVTRVEDNLQTKKISGQEERKKDAPAALTPRDELEKVLDQEHAAAVVEHRQRLRKPLTSHAARLLAGKLSKAPDANAAADTMIVKGWQSWEPHWGQDRPNATAPPQQEPRNAGERALLKLQAERNHEPPDTAPRRLEASDGRRQIEGYGDVVAFAGPQGAFARS